MSNVRDTGELLRLVELVTAGEADKAQLTRLSELLGEDEYLRNLYANAWLLEIEMQRLFNSPGSPERPVDEAILSCLAQDDLSISAWTENRRKPHKAVVPISSWMVAAAMLIVAALAFTAGRTTLNNREGPRAPLISSSENASRGPIERAGVSVKLTKATNCVWNGHEGRSPRESQTGFHEGDRLELLEGFATFALSSEDWGATVQIEGPAAIVFTPNGLPELRHGKILVTSVWSVRDRLAIGLPYAEVSIVPNSEVGVGAFGATCEVHVFSGAASLEGLWGLDEPRTARDNRAEVVLEGHSLQLSVASNGSLTMQEGSADRGRYDARAIVKGGQLIVTDAYIEKVIADRPIAYWRFENPSEKVVPNVMQDLFHLQVHGGVQFYGLAGNRCAAFPLDAGADSSRFLSTDQPLSNYLADDYTIEFWVNPSHYHTATIATLVAPEAKHGNPPTWADDRRESRHGLLIELGGFYGERQLMRPRKFRYVHRRPARDFGGGSVFSDCTYAVRKWQHLVCVKSGKALQIYFDGELHGVATDETNLEEGLIVVIGQISDGRFKRPFYGQIDEVAVYDHALTSEQIRAHHDEVEFIGPTDKGGTL